MELQLESEMSILTVEQEESMAVTEYNEEVIYC